MYHTKNVRQGTKFVSEKMAEKSRFRELSTDEIQKTLENVIGGDRKATNFGLKLLNGTYLRSFLTNLKKL